MTILKGNNRNQFLDQDTATDTVNQLNLAAVNFSYFAKFE